MYQPAEISFQGVIKKRVNCRFCNNSDLKKFLDLGLMPLAGRFPKEEEHDKYPLRLYVCDECGLVQVTDLIGPEILFKDYRYTSSTTMTIRDHFQKYAEEVKTRFLKKNSLAVEIGSNDGVLLEPLKNLGVNVLGVEPAANIAKIAEDKGLDVVVDFFNVETAKRIVRKNGKADAILANNVLAHIDEMDEIFEGIRTLLDEKGVLIFEVQYLAELVKKVQYDNIYHEHMAYYSLKPLIYFLNKYCMKLFDVKQVPTHGGSIRVFAALADNETYPVSETVSEMLREEEELGVHDYEGLSDFSRRVASHREKIRELLDRIKREGKTICGYGAAARGTIFTNYCGIGNDYLEYVIDASPERYNRFVPGTLVKIFPPNHLRENPTNAFLMMAWTYKDEILKKEAWFLEKGGEIIVPFPEPRIINSRTKLS
jgi:SAM-dependent methyltransferase